MVPTVQLMIFSSNLRVCGFNNCVLTIHIGFLQMCVVLYKCIHFFVCTCILQTVRFVGDFCSFRYIFFAILFKSVALFVYVCVCDFIFLYVCVNVGVCAGEIMCMYVLYIYDNNHHYFRLFFFSSLG